MQRFILILFAASVCTAIRQCVMDGTLEEVREPMVSMSAEDLVQKVRRHYDERFSHITPKPIHDVYITEDRLMLKLYFARKCSFHIQGPDQVPGTLGSSCDIQSPQNCITKVNFKHAQAFSTSRSETSSIGVSLGLAKIFSLGVEMSDSRTKTVTHIWDKGVEQQHEFSLRPGQSCVMKVASYAYKCDYSVSTVDKEGWSWRSTAESRYKDHVGDKWEINYDDPHIPDSSTKVNTVYLLLLDKWGYKGNYVDVYWCNSGGYCHYGQGFVLQEPFLLGEVNPITKSNNAAPGYVGCIID